MGKPLCSGCEMGQPCTGWTVDTLDDGTTYHTHCDGPGLVRVNGTWVRDRHDKGDDE